MAEETNTSFWQIENEQEQYNEIFVEFHFSDCLFRQQVIRLAFALEQQQTLVELNHQLYVAFIRQPLVVFQLICANDADAQQYANHDKGKDRCCRP